MDEQTLEQTLHSTWNHVLFSWSPYLKASINMTSQVSPREVPALLPALWPPLTTFSYVAHSLSSKQQFVPPWRFLQGARFLVGYRPAAFLFLTVVEMILFLLSLEANIGEIRQQKWKWAFNGNEIIWATKQHSHFPLGASVPLPGWEPSATRRHITNTPSLPQSQTQALCHLD